MLLIVLLLVMIVLVIKLLCLFKNFVVLWMIILVLSNKGDWFNGVINVLFIVISSLCFLVILEIVLILVILK